MYQQERKMKTQECTTTKVCNICEIEKSLNEFYTRKGSTQKYCLECKREKGRSHYRKNKDAYKTRAKVWADDNREKRRKIVNEYDARNRERIREYHASKAVEVNAKRREDYAKNPYDKRIKSNEFYHENKHKPKIRAARARICGERQRSLKQATPGWANLDAINDVYMQSQNLNDKTGEKHNVDHIIPVKSNMVCGLHVENNLRVITAFENQSKGNKLVEDIVPS